MSKQCGKCMKIIDDRQRLTCNLCEHIYHLSCTSVPERRFYNTLIGEHRKNWICELCTNRSNREFDINVSTENSFQSLSIESENDIEDSGNTLPDNITDLNQSCPELQHLKTCQEIENMKRTIEDLRIKLLSAETEIENIVAENVALKNENAKKDKKIEQLRKFCTQTPTSTPKQNKRKKLKMPTSKVFEIQNENTVLDISDKMEDKNAHQITQGVKQEEKHVHCQDSETTRRRKLCILSSNRKNKVLKIIQGRLTDTDICHFLKPGCDIQQLLTGMEEKLKGFTMEDFCVIFIGEGDFEKTSNYVNTIEYIKNRIMLVQHTNVIICVPTFKCKRSVTLFNKRIEIFNKLLYLDNMLNEYAFVVDSNRNLAYTSEMFNYYTGKINNRAFKKIVESIVELINNIENYNSNIEIMLQVDVSLNKEILNDTIKSTCSPSKNEFFRT